MTTREVSTRMSVPEIVVAGLAVVVLMSGLFFVVANLLIDLVIGFIDPRLRVRQA